MTHIDLLKSRGACDEGITFASQYPDMQSAANACTDYEYLLWAVGYLLPERERVKVRCHIVRNTPITDGRTVWDLLTDPRSRARVELEERWANGEDVSDAERSAALDAAWDAAEFAEEFAAWDAARAAARAAVWAAARAAVWDAARAAAWDAAWDAAWAAAWDAAWDAARQWQMGYIKSLDWNTLTGGEA